MNNINNLILGRGERIRTFDPLVPNQMRYQAALLPDFLLHNLTICKIQDLLRYLAISLKYGMNRHRNHFLECFMLNHLLLLLVPHDSLTCEI